MAAESFKEFWRTARTRKRYLFLLKAMNIL